MIQTRRLTESETTSSIVFYFSLSCALCGSRDLAVRLADADRRANSPRWSASAFSAALAHIFLTESYRYAPASVVAPFDYTSMIWALVLGYAMFGEMPTLMIVLGAAIIAGAGLFVIWRERPARSGAQAWRARSDEVADDLLRTP